MKNSDKTVSYPGPRALKKRKRDTEPFEPTSIDFEDLLSKQNETVIDSSKFAKFIDSLEDPEKLYELGTRLREIPDLEVGYERAFICFQKAAIKGHAGAQNDIGTMFREGFGCESDIEAAIHWYQRSAENGEPMALYNLATIYLHGVEVEPNHDLSAKYMKLAADLGCIPACSDLGTMYRFGHGVDKDLHRAAELHLLAAIEGDFVAAGNLCDYYRELQEPAIKGNVVAAQVLHYIHANGYAEDANLAAGWTWIRWAHDVCLPRTRYELFDSIHGQVDYLFRKAMVSYSPNQRSEGDEYLTRLVQKQQNSVQSSWREILVVGGELGVIRLMGRWWFNGWEFVQETCDFAGELLDDEHIDVRNRSDIKSDWSAAEQLISEFALHRLHPIYVHPEFRERVFQLVCQMASEADEPMADEEEWSLFCEVNLTALE